MRRAFFLVSATATAAGFIACVGDDPVSATPSPDASTDAPVVVEDATDSSSNIDAGVPCAMDAEFTSVTKVPELSSAQGEYGVTLTPNRLAAYVGYPSIRVHTRTTPDGTFGAGVTLTGLPSGNNVWPTIGSDSTEMFFSNTTGGSAKLFRARLTPGGADDVTLLAGPNDPDAGVSDDRPYIANERALYFIRTINGQTYHIFRSERPSAAGTFASAVEVNGLGLNKHEADPVVTSDEREIYFSTYDVDDASQSPMRTVRATRTDPLLPFSAPIEVPELHVSGKRDRPMWLSADRCTLYLISTRDGADESSYDVFVATRKP